MLYSFDALQNVKYIKFFCKIFVKCFTCLWKQEAESCNKKQLNFLKKPCCQALCPCVCVSKRCPFCVLCLKVQKWTQTDTKVTFHLPPPTTRKLFLISNERYGKNKTFLLRWYGIDFALIKRYRQFCFLWLYIRRQRLSLYDLSTFCP